MDKIRIPPELLLPRPGRAESDEAPWARSRGYFRDGWHKFLRLAPARIALGVVLAIALFSLVCPLLSSRSESLMDPYYAKLPPRVGALSRLGIADGSVSRRLGDEGLARLYAISLGAKEGSPSAVISVGERQGRTREVKVDAYLEVGFIYKVLPRDEYERILLYEKEGGAQVLYPIISDSELGDANLWYKRGEDGLPLGVAADEIGADMPLIDNYLYDDNGDPVYALPSGYASGDVSGSVRVRLYYYNYYLYKNGTDPSYLFGTDSQGYDLALRVASGIRVSLLLAFATSLVNLAIGALVGAVEGYYGGAVDLVIERMTDVLSGVPFIVVATLFQIYLSDRLGAIPSLIFAFVLTGWLTTANRVRGQFFRYKNAEYVLAARTMGVGDGRIMWRHIFPNTLGTLITASALAIPGVIFTESLLSFLGIVNLGAEGVTSLGTLLSDASGIWVNYPHLMIAPALVISLLMISFNIMGNGLRDAFNPDAREGV